MASKADTRGGGRGPGQDRSKTIGSKAASAAEATIKSCNYVLFIFIYCALLTARVDRCEGSDSQLIYC